MSDLSPQSGPKRTLMIQIAVTNRDFMSTRPSPSRGRAGADAVGLGEASHTRPSRIIDAGSARRKLFIGHIRKVERFAAVRERDPGIAQACKVLALVIIVRFFGQSRHSSGRFPSGVALLHVVGSVLASRKHNTPRLA